MDLDYEQSAVERSTAIDPELPNKASPRSCDLARTIRKYLWNARRTNFKGENYFNFTQVEQLLTTNCIYELLRPCEDQSEPHKSRICPKLKARADEVKSRSSRLLALCIWADLPLSTFYTLFDSGIQDRDLPLEKTFTHSLVNNATLDRLLEYQSYFVPYAMSADGTFHHVRAGRPLPILFEEFEARIGHGSFSDVFRVEVDSEAEPFCQVWFLLLPEPFKMLTFRASTEYRICAETIQELP